MNVDPTAILALISEQTARIAELEAENRALRDALTTRSDLGQDVPPVPTA